MAYHSLKHYVRIHTLHEPSMLSFALVSFDRMENDSCVTLVRCKKENLRKELRRWGTFDENDFEHISYLECGEHYYADDSSLIIRLS